MLLTRRTFLNSLIALLCAWRPGYAFADPLAEAMAQATLGQPVEDGGGLALSAPDIAEDGALVPVTLESALPGVSKLWIFVEQNPVPLVASFTLDEALEPYVSLRVKMNDSGDVVALAQANGRFFTARKKVRVLAGGCG